AGGCAHERGANARAAGQLAKGLDLLARMPESADRLERELALSTTLGQVLTVAKGYGHPDVERVYDRAHQLAERVQQTPKLFPVLLGLTIHHAVPSDLSPARRLGQRVFAFAQHAPH